MLNNDSKYLPTVSEMFSLIVLPFPVTRKLACCPGLCSVTTCHNVSQRVTESHRESQSVTTCHNILSLPGMDRLAGKSCLPSVELTRYNTLQTDSIQYTVYVSNIAPSPSLLINIIHYITISWRKTDLSDIPVHCWSNRNVSLLSERLKLLLNPQKYSITLLQYTV